jgi:hypothetical protein
MWSTALFWDIDPATLDLEEHAPFIISRVLMRGTLEDWDQLKRIYGMERLKDELVKLPYLDARTLHFCSAYFDIPSAQFRCYTRTLFPNTP